MLPLYKSSILLVGVATLEGIMGLAPFALLLTKSITLFTLSRS